MLLTKYFCDRCKKLIPEEDDIIRVTLKYEVLNRNKNTSYSSRYRYSDLCTACFVKLNDTLQEIEKNKEELAKIDDSFEKIDDSLDD